jgi:hypothetical protein
MRDPFLSKLLREVEFIQAIGLLGRDGQVHCRDCGAGVERQDGWVMRFECPCGWFLTDGEVLDAA